MPAPKLIRWSVLAAVGVMAATGTAVATAGPAAAAYPPCTHPGWRTDWPESGTLLGEPTQIRSGPSRSCEPNVTGHVGQKVTYYCWVEGDDINGSDVGGNTWSFLVRASGGRGWANDLLLDNGGSHTHC
jgi:hypothetical protein